MKRVLTAMVLCCFLFVSCEIEEQEVPVTAVSIGQETAEMYIGETAQLSATVLPNNATDKTVLWASSKQSVATVSETGLVTAVNEGTSTITASASGKTDKCIVTVTKRVIPVNSVELNKTALELVEGETETLTATVKPDDATDKTVSWTSSNTEVATVEGGKVVALKEGEATITAAAGEKTASCHVKVSKLIIPVSSVELSKTTLELVEGDTETLTATVKPDDATDKTVVWASSNTEIATVEAGKVVALKEGEATITASAGEITATCLVKISKRIIPVSSVELNKTTLELVEGDTETLTATVKPDDATDKTVSWASSNTEVATVEEGKVVALKVGEATITATAGDKYASCKVTVSNKHVPVTGIMINMDNPPLEIEKGKTYTLTATIEPENATVKTVQWESSNEEVATVTQNGVVTAIKEGYTYISASITDTVDGRQVRFSDRCEARVVKHQMSVEEIFSLDDGTQVYTKPLTVMAKSTNGIIVADNTAALFVYKNTGFDNKVGDVVRISAEIITYLNWRELNNVISVETISTGNKVTYPTALDITYETTFDTTKDPFNRFTYVTLRATYMSYGSNAAGLTHYYDLKFHNNTEGGAYPHLFYPYDHQNPDEFLEGDEIEVTGYYMGYYAYTEAVFILPTNMWILSPSVKTLNEIAQVSDGTHVRTAPVTVVAKSTLGYMVVDEDNACMYVHDSSHGVQIGDRIRVNGHKATFRSFPELNKVSLIDKFSSGVTFDYPAATDISDFTVPLNTDAAPFNDYSYVKVTGKLKEIIDKANGLSYDILLNNSPEGDAYIHCFYPVAYQKESAFYQQLKALVDSGSTPEITCEGYYLGNDRTDGYGEFTIMPTTMSIKAQ